MILRSHQRTKDPEIKKYWTAQQLLHQTAMVQVFLYIFSIIQETAQQLQHQTAMVQVFLYIYSITVYWTPQSILRARLSFQSSELAPPPRILNSQVNVGMGGGG
jgi:hypothetical protein